jgi:hypothetical protein
MLRNLTLTTTAGDHVTGQVRGVSYPPLLPLQSA